jgi:hypothetical protein
MTTCFAFYRVAGTTGADIYTRFRDTNLTGKSISVKLRYDYGGSISKPAVIDDAANGEFHIEWDATDLVDGNHRFEYVVVEGGQTKIYPTEAGIALIVRPRV